ncbi:hypothetical protein ES708_10125 [subsurface metagenome]
MAKYQEILDAINHLIGKLYGENGFEGDIPEIKGHLEKINGHLDDHSKRLVVAETQIKERTASQIVSKMSKKAITGYGGIAITVITLLYYLGQARGWW